MYEQMDQLKRLPVNSDLLKLGPTNLDLLGIIQTRSETNSARKSYVFGPTFDEICFDRYIKRINHNLFTNIQVTDKVTTFRRSSIS